MAVMATKCAVVTYTNRRVRVPGGVRLGYACVIGVCSLGAPLPLTMRSKRGNLDVNVSVPVPHEEDEASEVD